MLKKLIILNQLRITSKKNQSNKLTYNTERINKMKEDFILFNIEQQKENKKERTKGSIKEKDKDMDKEKSIII